MSVHCCPFTDGSMSHPCTVGKNCSFGGIAVFCRNLDLVTVPTDLPVDTACLYLNGNKIPHLSTELNERPKGHKAQH